MSQNDEEAIRFQGLRERHVNIQKGVRYTVPGASPELRSAELQRSGRTDSAAAPAIGSGPSRDC